MREAQLQQKMVKMMRSLGYIVYKMDPTFQRGVPDLLVLAPGGETTFLEVKTPAGVVSPIQAQHHKQLKQLGFTVAVVRTIDEMLDVLP